MEEAICALNNNNLNDLYLIPQVGDLEKFLGVGGGAGRYLVTGSQRRTRSTMLGGEGRGAGRR